MKICFLQKMNSCLSSILMSTANLMQQETFANKKAFYTMSGTFSLNWYLTLHCWWQKSLKLIWPCYLYYYYTSEFSIILILKPKEHEIRYSLKIVHQNLFTYYSMLFKGKEYLIQKGLVEDCPMEIAKFIHTTRKIKAEPRRAFLDKRYVVYSGRGFTNLQFYQLTKHLRSVNK